MTNKKTRRKSQQHMIKALIVVLIVNAILLVTLIFAIKFGGGSEEPTTGKVVENTTENKSDNKPSKEESTNKDASDEGASKDEKETKDEDTSGDDDSKTDKDDKDDSSNKETEKLPEQEFGKWELSSLDTKQIPYGNDPDKQTAEGIPEGVFYYKKIWGKYNADFISDRTEEKVIYLTMDCGFDNTETEPILDILKKNDVKATFFVTSMFYDARPDLIRRMIDEGHRIGSHSINHLNMTTLDLAKQEEEIMDVVKKLKKDFDYDCRLFRYPEGQFSDQSLALVNNLGLKSVFWSYAYNDFSDVQPPVQESYEKAVKYIHPGAIYLLHASSSTNRAFLEDWIKAVRDKGYEFAGVYPVD